jgi:peptidoglycan/xylan/chitin deacetylase (PgdA/CDA1 family)
MSPRTVSIAHTGAGALRHIIEGIFSTLERAVTAFLYPWCALRERFGTRARVPILMYHQVSRPLKGNSSCRDSVSPARFEKQIRAILGAGYRVIPLGTLIRELRGSGAPAFGRSVVLTFDDGFRGQFVYAYPILRRHRLPATFFVIAGHVGEYAAFPHLAFEPATDGRGGAPSPAWLPVSWDELKEMAGSGIDIGSHSVSHRSLGLLDTGEAEREVRRSREILERGAGSRVEYFAYPFGSRAYGDFDRGIRDVVRDAGYGGACTTVVGRIGSGADRFALKRIPIEDGDGPFRIRCKLAGAYDWVGPIKELWQRLVAREDRVDAPLPLGAGGDGVEAA